MDNVARLLALAGHGPKPRVPITGTIIDGFVVDVTTGIVHGQYLAIDEHDYTKQPLFIYNRSVRFAGPGPPHQGCLDSVQCFGNSVGGSQVFFQS